MTITTTADLIDQARTAGRAATGRELLTGGPISTRSPIRGVVLGGLDAASDPDTAVTAASAVARTWATTPAPVRGNAVRLMGELLRERAEPLARLVSLEAGKIASEAMGEVQEMIDMCELAVGLSRQLWGRTIASERPEHRLSELWQPLGVTAVITAFNFPVAVWSWNAAVALVCGNPVVWKPSDKGVLTATAVHHIAREALARAGAPADVVQLVHGGPDAAVALADDPRVALVSATGSTAMGKALAPRVAARMGRSLLELGGNNAAIVTPSAVTDLTVRAVTFAAAGTAGQRCTTLRRLIVHRSRLDEITSRLASIYGTLAVGDPLAAGTLVGPLIDTASLARCESALATATGEGGTVVAGGTRALADEAPDAGYLRPAIVTMPAQSDLVRTETFGPILYVLAYDDLDEAIALNNGVPQGLASSIFTTDVREAERFCGPAGSDCGIVNVNIGPSGAEIGGAFGGEKETGGGREAGSDAWRAYMRRSTSTVNYGNALPLAQGVTFV